MASIVDVVYERLSPAAQNAYRALGQHPRGPFGPEALAATLDTTLAEATTVIRDLRCAGVIASAHPSRRSWLMSPLIHSHAVMLATSAEEHATAGREKRITEFYLAATRAANRRIMPAREDLPALPGQHHFVLPYFTSDGDAAGWVAQAWPVLSDLQRAAVDHEWFEPALQLVYAMEPVRMFHRRAHDTARMLNGLLPHEMKLTGTYRLVLYKLVARISLELRDYDRATHYAETASALADELGDLQGKASAIRTLAMIYDWSGNYLAAAVAYTRHLATIRALPDHAERETTSRRREALSLTDFAGVELHLRAYESARAHAVKAYDLFGTLEGGERYNRSRAALACVAARIGLHERLGMDDLAMLFSMTARAIEVFDDMYAVHELARAYSTMAQLADYAWPLLREAALNVSWAAGPSPTAPPGDRHNEACAAAELAAGAIATTCDAQVTDLRRWYQAVARAIAVCRCSGAIGELAYAIDLMATLAEFSVSVIHDEARRNALAAGRADAPEPAPRFAFWPWLSTPEAEIPICPSWTLCG